VHLSRLEQEQPDVRMSLRQPLSALMRTVLARVRTTGGTNADGGSTGASGAAGMDSAQERLLTDVQRLGSEKRTYEARLETMEKERGGMEQDLNSKLLYFSYSNISLQTPFLTPSFDCGLSSMHTCLRRPSIHSLTPTPILSSRVLD